MDFVTVTYMGIIFALQSYRKKIFLVRTTEFLFPAVMTYECYFLGFIVPLRVSILASRTYLRPTLTATIYQ